MPVSPDCDPLLLAPTIFESTLFEPLAPCHYRSVRSILERKFHAVRAVRSG